MYDCFECGPTARRYRRPIGEYLQNCIRNIYFNIFSSEAILLFDLLRYIFVFYNSEKRFFFHSFITVSYFQKHGACSCKSENRFYFIENKTFV